MSNYKSLAEFQTKLMVDPNLKAEFDANPEEVLKRVQEPIPNTTVYQIVVFSLGGAILLVIIGIVLLLLFDKSIEGSTATLFTAIASGAVGALAGLLAPSPGK